MIVPTTRVGGTVSHIAIAIQQRNKIETSGGEDSVQRFFRSFVVTLRDGARRERNPTRRLPGNADSVNRGSRMPPPRNSSSDAHDPVFRPSTRGPHTERPPAPNSRLAARITTMANMISLNRMVI